MKKLTSILLYIFFVAIFLVNSSHVLAQSATESATPSATSTPSATATPSAATQSATTLPETGAHDVLILTGAGIIFLIAGITAFSGTREIFNDFE